MTITTSTCIVVLCDGPDCDSDRGWPDDGPLHFTTRTGALDCLLGEKGDGWTQLPDGRLLCRSCSESADCAATDHQWSAWQPHRDDAGVEWRACFHCHGALEERLVEMGRP